MTPSGTARRWHIPPPLVHGPEPLEGGVVLAEVPEPVGLLLWQALRDVLLWVEAPPEQRAGLFDGEAGEARRRAIAAADPERMLTDALATLTSLIEAPERADGASVARACNDIATWAEGRGALGTALAFLQDAALAEPGDPAPALAAARMAARLGDHARAEVWYRRTIGIARRARSWRPYARAFSGLGTLYQSRGNLPGAQRFHVRALRGAKRGGLRLERAVALHDLFGLAVEAGRAREAERLAREAFAAYPPRSPRLAVLAHDVAYFWMEHGHFDRALRVFQSVAPLIERPIERLWVDADLMRAAAGAGDRALARSVAASVRERSRRSGMVAAAARAELEVARGELLLGEVDAAEASAAAALELATSRRDGRTIVMAESLRDSIRHRRASGAARKPPTEQERAAAGGAADTLAEEMIRALGELSPSDVSPRENPAPGMPESNVSSTTPLEAWTP
jgi:tetratricopeptide (TPR) repeat protein